MAGAAGMSGLHVLSAVLLVPKAESVVVMIQVPTWMGSLASERKQRRRIVMKIIAQV